MQSTKPPAVKSASAKRPTAVKWIVALSRVRLAFGLLIIGAGLYFTMPAESETLESFRRGWVRGTGYDVEEYGPAEAGQIAGAALIPIVLSALMLTFVRRRKLKALRVVAMVNVIASWTQPGALPLTIAMLVLAHRKSTQEYMGGGAAPPTASPARVNAPRQRAITVP